MSSPFQSGAHRGMIATTGLLSLAIVAGSLPAQARAAGPEQPSIVVRYGDLNLDTAAGAQALYRRIVGAAHQVCPEPRSRDLRSFAAARACRTEAIARAVRQVNSPRLAAAHNGQARQG